MKHPYHNRIDEIKMNAAFLEGIASAVSNPKTIARLEQCARDLAFLSEHVCANGYICKGGYDCTSDHK